MFDSGFRFSMQRTYFCLCLDQLGRYKDMNREIERLRTEPAAEGEEHIVEMNLAVQYEKREELVISPIVFAAMALEAFSYDYAATHLGQGYADRHIDALSVPSRLVVSTELAVGTRFPTDGQAYEGMTGLIKKRNELVHFKSKRFDLARPKEYADYREQFIAVLDTWARASPEIVRKVVKEVGRLHGNEEDYAWSIEPTRCHA